MELPVPHDFNIKHSPGLIARIAVNEIPFYRKQVDLFDGVSGPCNHLLVPGENKVSLLITEIPERQKPDWIWNFEFSVIRVTDKVVISKARWPELKAEHPAEEQSLPIYHAIKFNYDPDAPEPVWMNAPRESIPVEGTPELHEAVRRLHSAYERGDVDDFLGAFQVKMDEHRKFYGLVPEVAPAAAREHCKRQLEMPWDVDPYDPSQVVFESRANGRVAFVSRKDGVPPVRARHKTDERKAWGSNLLLTRVAGRWQIFQ